MKKHTLTITALAAVLALSVMPSCKKDDDKTKTRSELIVGNWKAHQEGEDENNNNVWDNSERKNVDSASNTTFTFNSGGTGSVVDQSFPLPISFSWNLSNNDNDIRIIYTIAGLGSDTLSGNLVSISESEMIIKDNTETPAYYMSLKK